MKLIDSKLIKFLIVGVLNTLVGAGIMFILYNVAAWSYWASSISNYIVGGILSFVLNKYFTFENKDISIIQIVLFILNLAVCYVIAYILAKWIIYHILINQSAIIKDNVAMFLGMCLYTCLNYIGQRFLVFNSKGVRYE